MIYVPCDFLIGRGSNVAIRSQDESQLKETFEDLNKLFQGLQDSQVGHAVAAEPDAWVLVVLSLLRIEGNRLKIIG